MNYNPSARFSWGAVGDVGAGLARPGAGDMFVPTPRRTGRGTENGLIPMNGLRLRLLPALLALAGLGWAASAAAQESRWFHTNTWSGSGTRQTPVFWVNGDRWLLRHNHDGNGFFQVYAYDDKGKLTEAPVSLAQAISGYTHLKGPGARYLKIVSTEGDWEVMADQFLSVAGEWRLMQLLSAAPTPLAKVAEWTGELGLDTYELQVDSPHWKVTCSNLGGNAVEFSVRDKRTGTVELATLSRKKETFDGWVHHAGTFVVRVDSWASEWKIEVQGEVAPEPTLPTP